MSQLPVSTTTLIESAPTDALDSSPLQKIPQDLQNRLDACAGVEKIDVLNETAWALRNTSPHLSGQLARTAHDLSIQEKYENGLAESLQCLSVCYSRFSNYKKTIEYATQAIDIFLRIGNLKNAASTLCTFGSVQKDTGNLREALETYHRSLSLYRQINFRRGEAAAMGNIALVYEKLGEYDECLKFNYLAVDIFEEVQDEAMLALSLNNLGIVLLVLKEYDKAKATFERALELSKKHQSHYGAAKALQNLSRLYDVLGEPEKSLAYDLQALPITRELGDKQGEAMAINGIGYHYLTRGSYGFALDYFEISRKIFEDIEDVESLSKCLMNTALAYQRRGELNKAELYFHHSLEKAEQAEAKEYTVEAHLCLSECYMQLGDMAKAFDHFKKYHEIEKQIFNEESDQRLKNLQVLHDVEQAKLKERGAIRDKLHGSVLSDISRIYGWATELSSASAALPEAHRQTLEKLCQTAQTAELSVRRMQWRLSEEVKTLYDLARHLEKIGRDLFRSRSFHTAGISVTFKAAELPAERLETICDLFQLAMTNAWKHSDASQVNLSFRLTGSAFEIRLEDDGKGFEAESVSTVGGIGDMHKLARELGAQLRIVSVPKGVVEQSGTTLTLTYPME